MNDQSNALLADMLRSLMGSGYGSPEALDLVEVIEHECGSEKASAAALAFHRWCVEGRPVVRNSMKRDYSRQERWRRKRVAAGGCWGCGRMVPEGGGTRCPLCRMKRSRAMIKDGGRDQESNKGE